MNTIRKIPDTDAKMSTAESIAIEMREAVIAAGGKREWFETRDAWLMRAAQKLGLRQRRAKSLFYLKVRTVPGHELDNIRRAVMDLRASAERRRARLDEVEARIGAHMGEAGAPRGSRRELFDRAG